MAIQTSPKPGVKKATRKADIIKQPPGYNTIRGLKPEERQRG